MVKNVTTEKRGSVTKSLSSDLQTPRSELKLTLTYLEIG